MSAELVCVGLATLDTIVALPHWPERDGRLIAEALVSAGGGPAATAAVTAARLGRSVAFVGTVGTDVEAETIRRALRGAGVDVSNLAQRPGPTAQSVILVERETKTRTILHVPGVQRDSLDPTALALCDAARWLHVDHAGWPLVRALPRGRLSVDAGNPVPDLELAGLGLYSPTASALGARYPGVSPPAAMARALAEGAQRVAVTLGDGGAIAADADGAWRVPAADVEVVSTLGAGDVFHGAIVSALLEGRSLADALRLANLAAALSCRALDGRSATPGRDELERALEAAPAAEPLSVLEG